MRALICILCFSCTLQASHIIGGNFEISQTGRNSFLVNLYIFKDCRPFTADLGDIYVRAYQRDNDSVFHDLILRLPPGDTLELGNECYTPPQLCVEQYSYNGTINLPDHPQGYIFVAQICCRNSVITNIQNPTDAGITWTATIPDPAEQNSTPDLGVYPPTGFLCLNYTRTLDLSADDPDADSLVYELVDPFDAPFRNTLRPPDPPPFNSINWKPGYSAANAIPGNPTLEIDQQTGMLKCKPGQLGLYVFAYSVSEYRNGIKIGEVRRDLQLEVLPCVIDLPPQFVAPLDSTFTFKAEEDQCVRVSVVDSNFSDTLFLTSEVIAVDQGAATSQPGKIRKIGTGTLNGDVCWRPSCADAFSNQSFKISLKAISHGCEGNSEIQREILFTPATLKDHIEGSIPNVFTPNGDGVNDLFHLKERETLACLGDLQIKIYNRWGVLVYENSLAHLAWDGTYNNKPVSEGVFFLVVSGTYREEVEYKSFLTLMR